MRSMGAGTTLGVLLVAWLVTSCVQSREVQDRQAAFDNVCARSCHGLASIPAEDEDHALARMYWEVEDNGDFHQVRLKRGADALP